MKKLISFGRKKKYYRAFFYCFYLKVRIIGFSQQMKETNQKAVQWKSTIKGRVTV